MSTKHFLSDVHAVILEQGLGKARVQILTKQLQNHGGKVENTLSRKTTHILVGKTTRLSRIPSLLKIKSIPEDVLVLRADWLSACLVETEKVGHGAYVVHPEPSPTSSPSKDKGTTKTSPAAVKTPPKQRASPRQAVKLTSPNEEHGDNKSPEPSSKTPTTPTKPATAAATSLSSPKVNC